MHLCVNVCVCMWVGGCAYICVYVSLCTQVCVHMFLQTQPACATEARRHAGRVVDCVTGVSPRRASAGRTGVRVTGAYSVKRVVALNLPVGGVGLVAQRVCCMCACFALGVVTTYAGSYMLFMEGSLPMFTCLNYL